MASRKKQVQTHIVEYHNEALKYIYRGIGAKILSYDQLTMVHFDSHPDLGIPFDFEAEDVYRKDKLLESLQIESWILPAVYAGHINNILWLKPEWSTQLPEGEHFLTVGKSPTDGKIKVTSRLSYFVSDCLFCDEDELMNKKQVSITTITVKKDQNSQISLSNYLHHDQCYILDIDLDFFSTCNPFLEMFSEEDLSTLTDLYWFHTPATDSVDSILSCQRKRQAQLSKLKTWMKRMQNNESYDDENCESHDDENCESHDNEKFQLLQRIVKNYETSTSRKLDNEDIEILHGAGCATDEPSLPHHVSTEIEINELIQEVGKILVTANNPPAIITIARSSEDGYCPPLQVDAIQHKTLALLQELYSSMSVFEHYLIT